jgi:hypothetical protein
VPLVYLFVVVVTPRTLAEENLQDVPVLVIVVLVVVVAAANVPVVVLFVALRILMSPLSWHYHRVFVDLPQ